MSLNSSLYTGTSGLINMGNAMQVIGDNIANVNTVGYKGGRYTFADLLSQNVATQAGIGQIGRGMSLGSVDSRFQQGSFESTGNSTDLSIGGDGFFVVRQAGTQQDYYTRAGNFNFDKDGVLVNPTGHVLQGWKLDGETGEDVGAITDIILSTFTSPPKVTEKISIITNLDADADSKAQVLSNEWDGTTKLPDPPISADNYQYQTVVKAYDSFGSTHDLTIYYDKKETGKWEYMVTCNPDEDKRNLVQGTAGQGLLAKGIVTYDDADGTIKDITMEEFSGIINSVAVKSTGGISAEKTNIEIKNYDAFKKDSIEEITLTYDSATKEWGPVGAGAVLAGPYGATIITDTSNAKTIAIAFNSDDPIVGPVDDPLTPVDLEIKIDGEPKNGDTISFKIVDPEKINVQDAVNLAYVGDTADGNTIMTIENPDAITENFASGITLNFTVASGATAASGTWGLTLASGSTLSGTAYENGIGGLNSGVVGSGVVGDEKKLQVDLDGDGVTDISFAFTDDLTLSSSITFNLEGTTAWTDQKTNKNGYYDFTTDFLGGKDGKTRMDVEFDIGAKKDDAGVVVNDSLASTQYARASSTIFQTADGYGVGDLQGVDIANDGVMTGMYSNGQNTPLFRVALAKFINNQGLRKDGGNLFQETRDSGVAITNKPGENGLGTIAANSLEMSNIDVAEEFVRMITTQRGFQANSKIITTTDGMLETVIQMKR